MRKISVNEGYNTDGEYLHIRVTTCKPNLSDIAGILMILVPWPSQILRQEFYTPLIQSKSMSENTDMVRWVCQWKCLLSAYPNGWDRIPDEVLNNQNRDTIWITYQTPMKCTWGSRQYVCLNRAWSCSEVSASRQVNRIILPGIFVEFIPVSFLLPQYNL